MKTEQLSVPQILGNISQFSSTTVSFNSMTFDTLSVYTASLDNINSNTPSYSTMTNANLTSTFANSSLINVTVNFFTDSYPNETRWEILIVHFQ